MQKSKAQCPAPTPLVINSITVTESRCQASGVATVLVSGGSTPYTYSIIAGTTLLPPQSSNILQSLAPGNYTVQVTDNCNTSVTRNFTISGTYAVPALNVTSQSPTCPGSSDGSITITANGRAPLTYSLISPSPVTRGPQTANVFTGLPVGTYTCRVNDSCGNFQSRTVSLSAPTSTVTLNTSRMQYLACDSFAVILTFDISNYRPPYTISVSPPTGPVVTHVLTAPNAGSFNDTFRIRFHHTTGFVEQMPVTVTNQCGVSSTGNVILSTDMDLSVNPTLPGACGSQYSYMFDRNPASLHCGTITYTLVSPSGAVLATQTNNSTFSGFSPGTGYKVVRQDCCRRDSVTFNWQAAPAFQISHTQNLPYATCREGTTALLIQFNYSNQPADIVLASGPPSVRFADGTVHTYTYPDTTKNFASYGILGYFGPGTYKLYAINNTCGQKDSLTITFGPNDVRHSVFTAALQKGCAADNKILLNATGPGWAPGHVTVNSIFSNTFIGPDVSITDSLTNLSAGTYHATYQYQHNYWTTYFGGTNPGCDVIRDTIVIPVYNQPRFNSTAAVALCGATRQVGLVPDSTRGVAPYQWQILAGPTTRPMQASPVFTGLVGGTYTFLMADACANSYSQSITIDTLRLPNAATTGSTCVGGAATFTLPASPFYNYTWQRPNGSTSTGNTLTLNPVTVSDLGAYTISVNCTIAGCTNTTSRSLMLNPCQALPQTLLHFSGQRKNSTIQLNWQTADEINMSHYIVERSAAGIVFTPVQQVAAKGEVLNSYTATDMHVPGGSVYYRLQSIEKNGTINYSSVISFNNEKARPFNVYPSLITGNTAVTVTCPVTSHTSFIRVVGVDGIVLKTVPVYAGVTKTRIDVTSLAKGSYFVVFTSDNNVITTQIWKE
ncbi:T9SS type A sorting domain-containing protein [Niastella caeni]|nr:T9SS type A sorting domain-containing protein [Niastella caeni]